MNSIPVPHHLDTELSGGEVGLHSSLLCQNWENENENKILSNSHSFLISTLTLAILFFVLKPSILLNSTKLLSLSLFYY